MIVGVALYVLFIVLIETGAGLWLSRRFPDVDRSPQAFVDALVEALQDWLVMRLFAVLLLLGAIVVFTLLAPAEPSSKDLVALLAGISLCIWLTLAVWAWRRRQAGATLWDLGPRRSRLSAWTTTSFLSIGISFLIGFALEPSNVIGIASAVVSFSFAGLFFFLGWQASTRFTEKGISSGSIPLFRWERIASYRWTGGNDHVLLLCVVRRLFTFSRTRVYRMQVPPGHRDPIDSILGQYVAAVESSQNTNLRRP